MHTRREKKTKKTRNSDIITHLSEKSNTNLIEETVQKNKIPDHKQNSTTLYLLEVSVMIFLGLRVMVFNPQILPS